MSTYEISQSSLLSLKAEILRKREELGKVKAENEVKTRNLAKNSPLEIKNKGVENREKNDITEEDEDLMKKSEAALKAKSRLYDKLSKDSSNLSVEEKRRYLVRFDKKASRVPDLPPEETEDDFDRYPDSDEDRNLSRHYEPARNWDEEWVEYVDCLGRTRTCLRKDLEYIKSKDRDLESIVEEKRRNRGESPVRRRRSPTPEPEPEPTEDSELLSNDMRREMLRRQWEKQEDELRNKTDIHYQDILFDEARTHGVGYYGFSKDEEERAKQQEALKKLRQETKQQQQKSQELKAKREKQLAARVKAAKNRKRARMGLPPEEDEPEPAPEPEKPQEEPKEDDEKEKELEDARKKHVRPWDIGKEGVKEHYVYTQEEWVEKKRDERTAEFAPPSSYRKDPKSSRRRDDSPDRSLRFTTKRRKSWDSDESPKRGNPYKTNSAKPMAPIPIVNECHDADDKQDALLADYLLVSGSADEDKRGKGVEIAPPPTFEYYGPNDGNKKRKVKQTSNMGDSIEAGLRFLREQMEKKQSGKRSEDIFLS